MCAPYRACSIALLVLLALVLATPATRAAASGPAFGLRPARYDPARPATQGYFIYDLAPGQQVRDEVLVRNGGDQAGIVRLYPVDGTTASGSGATYLEEEAPRRAVGSWIQLTEREFALGPGEERVVPFTVTIPADAAPGQHLGGLAAANAAISQGTPAGAIQINTRTRAVTAVQVNLPGPVVEQVAVTGVTTGGRQARQTIILGLRNDGTAMVKPSGTLTVTDAGGATLQQLPLALDTFLPGSAIEYPVAVQRQALGAGQYRATVELTYGQSGVTRYEGGFAITAAQVAQVFPSAAPLAPPAAAAAPAAASAPSPGAGPWSPRRIWSSVAGLLLMLAIAGNVALLWRLRAKGRRA